MTCLKHTYGLFIRNIKLKVFRSKYQFILEMLFPLQVCLLILLLNFVLLKRQSFMEDRNVYDIGDGLLWRKPMVMSARKSRFVDDESKVVGMIRNISQIYRYPTVIQENYKVYDYLKSYKSYAGYMEMGYTLLESDVFRILLVNKTDLMESNQTKRYVFSGFLEQQNEISEALFNFRHPDAPVHIDFKRTVFNDNSILKIVNLVVKYLYPFYFAVGGAMQIWQPFLITLVAEKKAKLKSYLQLNGCSMVAYPLAWYIFLGCQIFGIALLTTLFAFALKILKYTNFFLFFLMYWMYLVSMVPLAYITSLFFKNIRTASFGGTIFFFFVMVVWGFTRFFLDISYSTVFLIFANLFSPNAFLEFMYYSTQAENDHEYLSFGSMHKVGFNRSYDLRVTLVCIFLDIILYSLLSLYLEKTISSDDYRGESFYFFLKPSFWRNLCSSRRRIMLNYDESLVPLQDLDIQNSDEENDELSSMGANPSIPQTSENMMDIGMPVIGTGIEITNVRKSFRKKILFWTRKETKVLNDLTIEVDIGQICVLLANNGGGKTTLTKIIGGQLLQDAGSIRVNGYNTKYDMDQIRGMIGFVQQEDILYDDLTVLEHLQLFALIHGVPFSKLKSESLYWISQVELQEKTHVYTYNLSGGQKRRLSLAMALIGHPEILILDEITSGVDVVSQRKIWDILIEYKKKSAILLTSHNSEECESLADKIFFIKNGSVEITGTPLSLKMELNSNYTLIMEGKSLNATDCMNEIQKIIPNATLLSHTNSMVSIQFSIQDSHLFGKVLRRLDQMKPIWKFEYELTINTLEERLLLLMQE